MLVAQAIDESAALVTRDSNMALCAVPIVRV
jgi:hypothetical protein